MAQPIEMLVWYHPRHDLFTSIADMNHGQMAVVNIGANVSCAETAELIEMLSRLV